MFEFHTKINGTSFRPENLPTLKGLVKEQELSLLPEPTNKYDPNAIAIYLQDKHLGYIPRDTAAKIVGDVNANTVKCVVSEVTGGVEGKENIGVNIKLIVNRPDEVKTQ